MKLPFLGNGAPAKSNGAAAKPRVLGRRSERPERTLPDQAQLDLDEVCDPFKQRERWYAEMTDLLEVYMRSPAFLACLKYGLTLHNVHTRWSAKATARAAPSAAVIESPDSAHLSRRTVP